MKKQKSTNIECSDCHCHKSQNNNSTIYGIGMLGAAYYFFSSAVGISGFFMAVLKTLLWPAFIVYYAFLKL